MQCSLLQFALGFWKALAKVYGNTRQQRCWVHKTGNVLLPAEGGAAQGQASTPPWMAETRQDAYRVFDEFITTYQLKFPKATACLAKDREELLAFYDFPAEHFSGPPTPSSRRLPPSADRQDSRLSVQANHADDGLQAVPQCTETMASVTGLPPAIENVKFINGVREDEIAA